MSLNTPGGGGKEGSRQRAPTDCVQGFTGDFWRLIGCYRVFTRKPWPQEIGALLTESPLSPRRPPTPPPIRRGVRRNAPQAIGALLTESPLSPTVPYRSSAVCGAIAITIPLVRGIFIALDMMIVISIPDRTRRPSFSFNTVYSSP